MFVVSTPPEEGSLTPNKRISSRKYRRKFPCPRMPLSSNVTPLLVQSTHTKLAWRLKDIVCVWARLRCRQKHTLHSRPTCARLKYSRDTSAVLSQHLLRYTFRVPTRLVFSAAAGRHQARFENDLPCEFRDFCGAWVSISGRQ